MKDIIKYIIGAVLIALLSGIVNNYLTVVRLQVTVSDMDDRLDLIEHRVFGESHGKHK